MNNIDLENTVFIGDARQTGIPDEYIDLIVTSPPYNVGKEYEADLSPDEYKNLIQEFVKESYRILKSGGRLCINIADIGRNPYLPLHVLVVNWALEQNFRMRGTIIWNKAASVGPSTAWGSWRSASNPSLRDVHEYILVFQKLPFGREKGRKKDTIEKDDFLCSTLSIWDFQTVSAKQIGHPAPFPVELPRRLIELYSFQGDIVLDPFVGSGTTCIAALKTRRKFIGIDTEKEYVALTKNRIQRVVGFWIVGNPQRSLDVWTMSAKCSENEKK